MGGRRFAALGLLACTLALGAASHGAAQAAPAPPCPERDIVVDQAGVGSVSADALDTEGDLAVLTNACFSQRGLTFDTPELRVQGGVARTAALSISGAGVTGTAETASVQGQAFTLSGLGLDLTLPAGVLGDLPLPAGRYRLEADVANLGQDSSLGLGQATLRGEGGQRYLLRDAQYRSNRLIARHAELGRLAADDLRVVPGEIVAAQSVIGLCRDPQANELQLATGPLAASPAGTVAQDARLRVLGTDLFHTRRLDLPIRAGTGTLAATVQGLEPGIATFQARLGGAPPQVVIGEGRYGLRDLFFLDPYDTRFNFVVHPSFVESGIGLHLGQNRVRFGVFEDPDVVNVPLAEASVVSDNPLGIGYGIALRTPERLSDARLGYGGLFGPLSYRLEGGIGRQNGVNAAFGHAVTTLSYATGIGPVSLGGSATGDTYVFGVGTQFALTIQGGASVGAGPLNLSVSHLDRTVWGAAPLPGLVPSRERLTTGILTYAPPVPPGNGWRFTGASFVSQYDWLARDFTENRLAATARYDAPDVTLLPRAYYDFAIKEVSVGTDVLRNTACFAYGLGADVTVRPQVPGSLKFTVGFRFQLR